MEEIAAAASSNISQVVHNTTSGERIEDLQGGDCFSNCAESLEILCEKEISSVHTSEVGNEEEHRSNNTERNQRLNANATEFVPSFDAASIVMNSDVVSGLALSDCDNTYSTDYLCGYYDENGVYCEWPSFSYHIDYASYGNSNGTDAVAHDSSCTDSVRLTKKKKGKSFACSASGGQNQKIDNSSLTQQNCHGRREKSVARRKRESDKQPRDDQALLKNNQEINWKSYERKSAENHFVDPQIGRSSASRSRKRNKQLKGKDKHMRDAIDVGIATIISTNDSPVDYTEEFPSLCETKQQVISTNNFSGVVKDSIRKEEIRRLELMQGNRKSFWTSLSFERNDSPIAVGPTISSAVSPTIVADSGKQHGDDVSSGNLDTLSYDATFIDTCLTVDNPRQLPRLSTRVSQHAAEKFKDRWIAIAADIRKKGITKNLDVDANHDKFSENSAAANWHTLLSPAVPPSDKLYLPIPNGSNERSISRPLCMGCRSNNREILLRWWSAIFQSKHQEMCELLQLGFDWDVPFDFKYYQSLQESHRNYQSVVESIAPKKLPELSIFDNLTALHICTMIPGNMVLLEYLLQQVSVCRNIDVKDRRRKQTAMHTACSVGCTEAAIMLIKGNCDINNKDKLGETPLHKAVRINSLPIVTSLLSRSAKTSLGISGNHNNIKINIRNKRRESPLLLATNRDMVLLLINAGADVTYTDVDGFDIACKAARDGNARMLSAIINTNAYLRNSNASATPSINLFSPIVEDSINSTENRSSGKQYTTALHQACQFGHEECVKLILALENNDDLNSRDSPHYFTPLMYAAIYGHESIVEYLVNRRLLRWEHEDSNGCNSIVIAALNKNFKCVNCMLQIIKELYGIDRIVLYRNCYGESMLEVLVRVLVLAKLSRGTSSNLPFQNRVKDPNNLDSNRDDLDNELNYRQHVLSGNGTEFEYYSNGGYIQDESNKAITKNLFIDYLLPIELLIRCGIAITDKFLKDFLCFNNDAKVLFDRSKLSFASTLLFLDIRQSMIGIHPFGGLNHSDSSSYIETSNLSDVDFHKDNGSVGRLLDPAYMDVRMFLARGEFIDTYAFILSARSELLHTMLSSTILSYTTATTINFYGAYKSLDFRHHEKEVMQILLDWMVTDDAAFLNMLDKETTIELLFLADELLITTLKYILEERIVCSWKEYDIVVLEAISASIIVPLISLLVQSSEFVEALRKRIEDEDSSKPSQPSKANLLPNRSLSSEVLVSPTNKISLSAKDDTKIDRNLQSSGFIHDCTTQKSRVGIAEKIGALSSKCCRMHYQRVGISKTLAETIQFANVNFYDIVLSVNVSSPAASAADETSCYFLAHRSVLSKASGKLEGMIRFHLMQHWNTSISHDRIDASVDIKEKFTTLHLSLSNITSEQIQLVLSHIYGDSRILEERFAVHTGCPTCNRYYQDESFIKASSNSVRDLIDLMYIADEYMIKSLKLVLENYAIRSMTFENCAFFVYVSIDCRLSKMLAFASFLCLNSFNKGVSSALGTPRVKNVVGNQQILSYYKAAEGKSCEDPSQNDIISDQNTINGKEEEELLHTVLLALLEYNPNDYDT